HTFGRGKVDPRASLAEVLRALQVPPDAAFTPSAPDRQVLFVHRKLADGDLYFVDIRAGQAVTVDAAFRVQGKAPELWHPDTGRIEPAGYRIGDGRTHVPLRLDPFETVFVVFRTPARSASRSLPSVSESPLAVLEGPWEVHFQPDRGAPPS